VSCSASELTLPAGRCIPGSAGRKATRATAGLFLCTLLQTLAQGKQSELTPKFIVLLPGLYPASPPLLRRCGEHRVPLVPALRSAAACPAPANGSEPPRQRPAPSWPWFWGGCGSRVRRKQQGITRREMGWSYPCSLEHDGAGEPSAPGQDCSPPRACPEHGRLGRSRARHAPRATSTPWQG